MTKLEAGLSQFKNAVARLEDALKQTPNEYIKDSAIQRFEFCFDLSWKLIKTFLEDRGIRCSSPKDCFRMAYGQALLEYDEFWLEMTDLRNLTVHTYDQNLADEVYGKLPKILDYLKKLLENIEK